MSVFRLSHIRVAPSHPWSWGLHAPSWWSNWSLALCFHSRWNGFPFWVLAGASERQLLSPDTSHVAAPPVVPCHRPQREQISKLPSVAWPPLPRGWDLLGWVVKGKASSTLATQEAAEWNGKWSGKPFSPARIFFFAVNKQEGRPSPETQVEADLDFSAVTSGPLCGERLQVMGPLDLEAPQGGTYIAKAAWDRAVDWPAVWLPARKPWVVVF